MNSYRSFFLCLIVLIPCNKSHADRYPFERLFTSSELREKLNETRYFDESELYSATIDMSNDAALTVLPKDEFVKVSGIVVHENGKNMVWINGKSDLSKEPDYTKEEFYLGKDRKVRVKNGVDSKKLKAGQVWVLDRNDVKEGFEITMPKKNRAINKSMGDSEISIQDSMSADATQVLLDAIGPK